MARPFLEQAPFRTILEDNPDFVMLAKAFDIPAERIERADDVDAALNRLLNSETAYLLQVCIPPEECVWPISPTRCM